jgi:hypothetical protein
MKSREAILQDNLDRVKELAERQGKLLDKLKTMAEDMRYNERLFFEPTYITEQHLQRALMDVLDTILDEY